MLASPLHAQDAFLDFFQFEKSYAAAGTPNVIGAPGYYAAQAEPKLLAEAQFLARFPLYRGLRFQEVQDGTGRGFNLYLTTQFRLRGLDVQSGPVRSPSFMPRFVGQYLWAYVPDTSDGTRRRVAAVYATLGHHSNGGDGCTFADEVADAEDRCVSTLPPGTPASQREIRIRNGNFSTNYLEVGAAYRVGRVLDDPDLHWVWAVDGALSVQYHHRVDFPLPGGAEPAFGALYGTVRPRLDVSAHRLVGTWMATRFWASGEYFSPDESRYPGALDYRLETELLVQFPYRSNQPNVWRRVAGIVGLGVRYVRGQDFYNTQFVRDIENVQLVLVMDPWSPWIVR
jgi:hypothetical protein